MGRIGAILKCLVPCIRQGSRSTSETKSKKKTKEHHKKAKELQNNVHHRRRCLESEQEWQGEETEDDIGKEKNFLKQYPVIKFLGSGSFGNVTLVKRTLEGKERLYAMKTVHKTEFSEYIQPRRNVEKDVFLHAVGHPFLMQLHSYFETKEKYYYVMDYMPGGTMWSKLKKEKFFSEMRAGFYTAELTLAVEFLHKCGIVHRDIKLDNILLDEDGHCKLADYGLAVLDVYRGAEISVGCGTPCYCAPEMLQGSRYGPEIDWWALGIVMYEMMVGHHPFRIPKGPPLRQKIMKNTVLYPRRLSESAVSILNGFLTKDPRKRLGACGNTRAIKRHQFFKFINWKALQNKRMMLLCVPDSMDIIEMCPTNCESMKKEEERQEEEEEEEEEEERQQEKEDEEEGKEEKEEEGGGKEEDSGKEEEGGGKEEDSGKEEEEGGGGKEEDSGKEEGAGGKEEEEEAVPSGLKVMSIDNHNQQACRLISLHHAHLYLSIFLSFLSSFIPTNFRLQLIANVFQAVKAFWIKAGHSLFVGGGGDVSQG